MDQCNKKKLKIVVTCVFNGYERYIICCYNTTI